ncbi:MAG: hypothetical protein PHX87_03460 [Candidatus Peribacteraceae bacterium]|nr:hypothetical protein [Candidatus Peribacteraceae bacterium]MDD5742464.1 hypothetical protein [Candidatus Peribacteraceae bacterium]
MIGTLLLSAVLLPLSLTVRVQGQSSSSVPPGAQRVTMLALQLSASCSGDIAVHSVTVTHGGMGAIRDISSVYAMSGGRRISRGRALSSRDGSVMLTFRPALTVPACGSRDIAVMADFSTDAAAAGEHRISLLTSGDIDAGEATVTLTGTANVPLRTTAGAEQGSVTVEFLPLLQRISYGDRRTVARLRLTSEGAYDQAMDAITLTNDGSACDGDLQHLTLETSRGQILARLASLQGHLAPFVLATPFALERGQVFLLTVRADVRAGRRRTIGFTLEEPGDLISHRAQVRR